MSHSRKLDKAIREKNVLAACLYITKMRVVDKKDRNGCTPLYLAVSASLLPVVEALLAKGASPNSETNNGYTPYFCCTYT